MKFELNAYNRDASEANLVADVQRVASLLKKTSVTIEEQREHGRFNPSTLIRRFGSWNKTLKKADLTARKLHGISNEELFENIEELWISLGRQPFYRDLGKANGSFGGTTYNTRFGSWRKALEAFIDFINETENTSQLEMDEVQSLGTIPVKLGSRTVNWRLRFIVMRRDNFKCKACGRTPATDPSVTLDVDHIKAWSKGGPTVLENLQTLHKMQYRQERS